MDLNIFEKLREIYEGIRKIAWKVVSIAGLVWWAKWFLFTWLPARAKQFVEWVISLLPELNIDVASVNLPWDRINQWVPVNETIGYASIYITLACSIAFLKWIKKFTFW
jgi:hypothetical protein